MESFLPDPRTERVSESSIVLMFQRGLWNNNYRTLLEPFTKHDMNAQQHKSLYDYFKLNNEFP